MKRKKVLKFIVLAALVVTSCDKKPPACCEKEPPACGLEENGCYFLLLKDKETISLNTYENGKIREQKTFAIPENSIFATDREERVAILDTDKNLVTLYEIETSKKNELSIPFNMRPKTILINSDNLFVGGGMGGEILAQYHIQSEEWHRLEIPQEVSLWGKAIDDLVVNDCMLIAIDNVVYPKYILFYHLNSTGKLALSHFKMLKANGTYENIRQGRITPKYLGLLSTTSSGYIGVHEHITIYNNLNLTSSFAISMSGGSTISDFILIGDKLFIAHRVEGLGIFEIKNSYFSTGQGFNERVDANEIKYQQFENEEIIRLTIIPNDTKIILTIRNSLGKIRHEIIEA